VNGLLHGETNQQEPGEMDASIRRNSIRGAQNKPDFRPKGTLRAEEGHMRTIGFFVMLFIASDGLCQTPVKETDTLQSLLAEVHQLRMDIEAMTVASQRVQIALYELQKEPPCR
jgi:hypothetical protein